MDGVHYQLAPLEDAVCANPGVAASEAHRNGMRLNGGFGPATLARALTTVVVPTNNCPMTAAVIGKASYGTKVCPHAWPSLDWKHLAWRIESLNAHTAPLDNDSYVLAPPQRAVVLASLMSYNSPMFVDVDTAGVAGVGSQDEQLAENAETTALRLIAALILDPDTLRQRSLVWWLQLLLKPALAFPAQQARTGAAPPEGAPAVVESCIHVNRVRLATLLVHGYARVVRERLQPSRWNQLPTRIAPALSGEDAKLQKGFAYLAFALGRRMAARADDSVQLWEPPLRVVARSASRFAGLGSEPTAESQAQSDGGGALPTGSWRRNNSLPTRSATCCRRSASSSRRPTTPSGRWPRCPSSCAADSAPTTRKAPARRRTSRPT